MDLILEKNPKARIVAAAVTLESVAELTGISRDFPSRSVVCLSAARGREAGPYCLMAGQNPVYLFTFSL